MEKMVWACAGGFMRRRSWLAYFVVLGVLCVSSSFSRALLPGARMFLYWPCACFDVVYGGRLLETPQVV